MRHARNTICYSRETKRQIIAQFPTDMLSLLTNPRKSSATCVRPRWLATIFLPLALLVPAPFSASGQGGESQPGSVVPLAILPPKATTRVGDTEKTVKLTVLLGNDSVQDQVVRVDFVSSDPSVSPNPASAEVKVPGKKSPRLKPRPHREVFSVTIPANAAGIATLTAQIGAKSSPPATLHVMPETIHGDAQFFKVRAEDPLEPQACQLTRGRVTAYWADGSVLARGKLTSSGSFDLAQQDRRTRFPKRAAGLQPGEIRVVIDLPTGSTLMADSPATSFVQVSPLTTVLAVARRNRPGLSLEEAEAAVRSYFHLPATHSLEDMGGEASAFCEATFQDVVREWNKTKKRPLRDIDLFVEHVEDGVQDHADGRVATTRPFRTTLGAARLLGIGPDNADPLGSLDPDQHLGAAGEANVFDPSLYEKAGNLGLANSIVNSSGGGLGELAAFVLVFDAAGGNSGVGTLSKWVGGFGIAAVLSQTVASIVLTYLQNNEPDPVQEGLKFISNQIEALSSQLAQTEAKILFSQEKLRTQEKYEQLLSRLNTVSATLRPTSSAPQNAFQFQSASQIFSANPVGTSATTSLANSMLGISGSENGVRLFHRMLSTRLEMNPAVDQDRMSLPVRSNELILQARNLPMRYVNMLTSAMQVTSEESRVFMNLYGSPAQRLNALQDNFEAATPAFGNNGLAALRRRGLQQAPPRFGSPEILVDSTRGEQGRGLVWSREVRVQGFDATVVRSEDTSRTFRTYIDGDKFKPGNYRLNDELPAGIGWRLATLDELRSLPGWGKGDAGLQALKTKTGIDPKGGHWFAVFDPSAPSVIEVEKTGFGTISRGRTTGQVRFYSFHSGSEVDSLSATSKRNPPDTVNCLRVFDLHTFPGNATVPTVVVNDQLVNGLFAWPDDPARKPSWWPAKAYYSSIMRSVGIPPTDIVVLDKLVPNPWYSATPNDPREVPTHLKVLSALAYWELKSSGSETRGFVEDVSGLVEWQSSDTTAAVVTNMFNRFDSVTEAAEDEGRFVSPWFAPITFSKSNTQVTFTANWVQGLLSPNPSNRIIITQAADARLCVPPLACGLDVTPGNLLYTTVNQIDRIGMAATLYWSDRSAEDASNGVQWSLLEVTKDGSGNEATAPFPAELATISQGSGGQTGGILSVQAGAGTPARTLRVVATDPVSGLTGKADLLLQF